MRQIMDDGKVLLVNLAKGQIGEDSSYTWADCSSLRSSLLRLAAPTYPSMNGVRSLSTSTSLNTLRRSPSRICSQSFASIGSALQSPTNTSISLNQRCVTPFSETPVRSYSLGLIQTVRHTWRGKFKADLMKPICLQLSNYRLLKADD